jgi:hypothetical protein
MPEIDLGYTPAQKAIFFPAEEKRFNIFPCGRRFGKTQGAAHACIEWAIEGMPILWGDTVNANITKYVERYFLPPLKPSGIRHRWRSDKNILEIGRGYIDFRSADNPSNWEGFGYKKIVLNEAGVILGDQEGNKGPYLYANTVLPMMMDYRDSQLYAIGAPKGKKLKKVEEVHPFYRLWEKAETEATYRRGSFSSYDNPLLGPSDIEELEKEIAAMSPGMQRQEIWAEFIDGTAGELFAHAYDRAKHQKPCKLRPIDTHYFSIDFNVHPFCAIVGQIWQDGAGHHVTVPKEITIRSGTVEEMAHQMRTICPLTHLMQVTGDKGGEAERIRASDNLSLFEELRIALGITRQQVKVLANPRHKVSREQTNYVLAHHPDLSIDPGCTGLNSDFQTVEVGNDGEILKSDRSKANQKADHLDCFRYFVNTYLSPWIERNRHALRRHI